MSGIELNFSREDVERASRHLKIIHTVQLYESFLEKYMSCYDRLDKKVLTDLHQLCDSISEIDSQLQPKGSTYTSLYESALSAFPQFKNLLRSVADECNGTLLMGPIKQLVRVMQKAEEDYEGDVCRVIDIVRASIVFPNIQHITDGLQRLIKSNDVEVIRVKNGFNGTLKSGGYMDVKVSLMVKQHVCELQLHLHEFLTLKNSGGHESYEKVRQLPIPGATNLGDLLQDKTPQSTRVLKQLLRLQFEAASLESDDARHDPKVFSALSALCRYGKVSAKELKQLQEFSEKPSCLLSDKVAVGETLVRRKMGSGDYKSALEICSGLESELNEAKVESGSRLAVNVRYWKARCYRETGEYAEGLKDMTSVYNTRKHLFGEDHPDTLNSLDQVAIFKQQLSKYADALHDFNVSLEKKRKLFKKNEDHPNIAASYNNIGLVFKDQGDCTNALMNYEKSLFICIKVLGEEHPSVATSYNNIGSVLCDRGDYEKALENFEKSLAIWIKVFGENHRKVIEMKNVIQPRIANKNMKNHWQ
jgi:tetratricopeptide (TPR) repeat protein